MRWLPEFDTTAWPREERFVSTSPATEESRPENRILDSNFSSHVLTTRAAADSGIRVPRRHVHASRYGLPAERSDAPSSTTSNQAGSASKLTKRCPPAPVAPRTP